MPAGVLLAAYSSIGGKVFDVASQLVHASALLSEAMQDFACGADKSSGYALVVGYRERGRGSLPVSYDI